MNRDYVEADRRIVLGFIEPHFMAGFSGGYKGIFPAVADIDSIMHYHRARGDRRPAQHLGRARGQPDAGADPRTTARSCRVDFCVNVTLNRDRADHRLLLRRRDRGPPAGCAFARRRRRWSPATAPFPIVVTTNGGYPLDQNLYQAVKGMSAAAQIVADGGYILTAARCNDGFPAHGNFKQLLFEHASPQAILDTI